MYVLSLLSYDFLSHFIFSQTALCFFLSLIPSHWRKCFLLWFKVMYSFCSYYIFFFFFFSASFWGNSYVWYVCLLQLVDSYHVSHLFPRMEDPRSNRPAAYHACLLPLPQATLSSSVIFTFILFSK